MNTIQLDNISFGYNPQSLVLKNINLTVPPSSIYGFLGKNGAGKTTTLRIILGLLKPQKGNVRIFEKDIKKTYPAHLSQIGPMIESPALYSHLSAKDNLRVSCKYTGTSTKRIAQVLEMVNLSYATKKKVKTFSTGMKQRLGVAIALLQDPEILILDEPTNGLDPNGIIEFRNILHRLQSEGKSIILSSHILSEVEKIASVIGIIHDGKMVFQGTLDEMQSLKNLEAHLQLSNMEKAINILQSEFAVRKNLESLFISISDQDDLAKAIKLLVEANIDVYQATPISKGLEEMFIEATEN